MRNMMQQNFPCRVQVLSSISTDIFLSLYKGKKIQQNFFIKKETQIYQIFQLLRHIQWFH